MDCGQMAIDESFMDFIFGNNLSFEDENIGGCTVRIDENWSVGYGMLPPGRTLSVADLKYHSIPKLYTTVDSSSFDSSGISAALSQPVLDVKGRGIVIGIIDTGIDYTDGVFKESPVSTRIGTMWDQSQSAWENQTEDNSAFFGKVYTRETINKALAALEEGENYRAIVPEVDETGHGTFVAGIAASAAPEAELAVVKLKPAKKYLKNFFLVDDKNDVYEETDMMLGVRFLLDYATKNNKPLVILVSLCTGSGPRTGATPFASVLSGAALRTNVVVVTAMGNEANSRTHISGTAVSNVNPYVCEVNVGKGEMGFVLELWASTIDVLSVSFLSPSGESVPRIPAKNRTDFSYRFLLEKTTVTVDYQVVEELSGYELIFIKFISPAQGVWRINVYSLTTIQGSFNMWLPIKKLMNSETFFLDSDPFVTLLEPAADERVISIGSYNHVTGGPDIDSGRGYSANGAVKPDVVAPGVNVSWPVEGESVQSAEGAIRVMSGTSVAAAHVAGMAALLLQWGVTDGNDRLMGNNQIKSILARGAVRNVNALQAGVTYPDPVSGYGKANIMDSFIQLRIN